jgi:hypothetical protein
MAASGVRSKAGFVYVLSNEAMPGIVKIGMTARNPEVRLRELNASTGVLPFTLEAVIASRNARWTEGEVHERLAARRVSKNREFFKVDVEEARRIIFNVARQQRQRVLLRGRKRIAPGAAVTLALTTSPAAGAVHPYLLPVWLLLCLAAALTGRPRLVRELLGATDRVISAALVGSLMLTCALLFNQIIGHDSFAAASMMLSELRRILFL